MQIPADKRIKRYELTFLIAANLTGEEVKQIESSVEALIKKHNGTSVSQEDWGKKPLAYLIKKASKKHVEAVYKHWVLDFETKDAYKFDKELFLIQTIVRHLFVVATEESGAQE